MHDGESPAPPALGWRVLLLAGAVLAVAFTVVGLQAYHRDEVVRCEISGEAGQQVFFSGIGEEVGEGCRYAQLAAQGVQDARYWWLAAGAVVVLTLAALPLIAALPRRRAAPGDGAEPRGRPRR